MLELDLMKMESIQMLVEKTIATFSKIDILINNAGIIRRTPAIDFSEKDWDDVMQINSKTVFFLSQACARDMMKRKYGKIINIASLLAFQGGILIPSYAASKGAVAQDYEINGERMGERWYYNKCYCSWIYGDE